VDPAILGGIIARIGDELYDGSVRTQLTQLAERIS
jgi:F0F1-type ATP synthase delta subunit